MNNAANTSYVPSVVRTDVVAYATLEELISSEASTQQRKAMKDLLKEETNLTLTIKHLLETMETRPIFEAKVKKIFDFSKVLKVVVAGIPCYIYAAPQE